MTTAPSSRPGPDDPRHIGILLFDGVEELDAVGPWEVLSWWTGSYPEDGYTASTFSADGRPVTCNKGLVVSPHHSRAVVPLMTSVCTGSLVYAQAGLLRDRPATTYWNALGGLTDRDPTIDVRPDARWVDDGDVITASGVSAGIDMALHLVVRLAGEERAREVRRGIQYDPAPPV
jgi:transcriptional regulator GlxA family with amidase domain